MTFVNRTGIAQLFFVLAFYFDVVYETSWLLSAFKRTLNCRMKYHIAQRCWMVFITVRINRPSAVARTFSSRRRSRLFHTAVRPWQYRHYRWPIASVLVADECVELSQTECIL